MVIVVVVLLFPFLVSTVEAQASLATNKHMDCAYGDVSK